MMTPAPRPGDAPTTPAMTEVRYEHTPNFAPLLEQLGISLLVSTYQAGKLLVLGTSSAGLSISFLNFEQVMGVGVHPRRLAIGTRRQISILHGAHDIAANIEPVGRHDACFLTRTAHVTGEIHGHDLAWAGDELWVVNTLFSCLCTLHPEFSFVPRWKPPFITSLAAEDRCHLNGLALEGGIPRYATALAECDTPAGWRPTKAQTGCLIDVFSGQTIARGLSMPHSPRVHNGELWVLDSGHGRLSRVERASGQIQPVAHLPGYTRGLSLHGPFAFVGLSKIRETSVFGGIPIAGQREQLKCGVAVVNLRSGQQMALFQFHSGVEEIFAVEVLPGIRCPYLSGPSPAADDRKTIWYVPPLGKRPSEAPA